MKEEVLESIGKLFKENNSQCPEDKSKNFLLRILQAILERLQRLITKIHDNARSTKPTIDNDGKEVSSATFTPETENKDAGPV